ncbi:SusD/RagB family nutrient-binding outer membrane lipoprotein [Parafilimonas sp.]|uniref:SusD/RagB family nutrient-binding outer membrane lipoprotein n=1 Tax=Parafilimonas sp. TaxID=1969739 RepID=UPI0039E2532C
MKKLLIYMGAVVCITSVSCTKNFDSINTDPTQASSEEFDANLLLPTAEINYLSTIQGYSGAILFQSMWAQIFASAAYPSYYSNGDKYVASTNILTYDASIWDNAYSAASKAYEIQNLVKDDDDLSNLSGIAFIVQLLNLELITDVYGDCPYSEALQAKTANISNPVYDEQSSIYPAMLSSLDSVIATLDASKTAPTNDLIYDGDIDQWKKFGYSLMLRMAMRLTKVDASTAQEYAELAYSGGTFESVDDNAYIAFDETDGYNNANISALQTTEDYQEVRWGKYLIDWLKSNDDPRLSIIAEVPEAGLTAAADQSLAGDDDADAQEGMPNGYDQNGGTTDITTATDYPGGSGTGDDYNPIGLYSRPKTALYLDLSSPGFILTYAETELLLAEAAVRGWSVGDASTHYHNGVSAALQSYATLNSDEGTISSATAEAYATAYPLDVTSTDASLEQINTQFWVTTGTLFNFIEAWNNWRRSGYPDLTPVSYSGNFTSGAIPRREIYPASEATTNGTNYSAGVSSMGGDTWVTRMWWDAE